MFGFLKKMDRRTRVILFTCYFAFFVNGSFSLMMGSAMPDLRAAFRLSDTFSGVLLSAHSVGNLIAGIVGSLIPLYLGERKAIMLMSSLAGAGFLMMISGGNPVWLFMAFVFTGFARGSVTSFTNRTVNRISAGSPQAANCLHASFAIGAVTAPLVFLLLSRLISWRAALLYIVALSAVSILNLRRMKLDVEYPDRNDRANRTLVFLKNPSYLILAMMMLFYMCSEYSINGWLVTYIQNKEELLSAFHATGEELEAAVKAYSQTMATLMWVLMFTGRLICAALLSKISKKKLLMCSGFGVVICYVLMISSASLPLVTIAVAGLGLCMSGMSPTIYSDAAIYTNTYPLATSFLLVFGSVGSILMNTIVGALADRFSFHAAMNAITVSIVLLAIFGVLNITVKTRMPEGAQN